MHQSSRNTELKQAALNEKLLGLPRSGAGALFGVVLFWIITLFIRLILWVFSVDAAYVDILLLPGVWVVAALGELVGNPLLSGPNPDSLSILATLIAYSVTSVPPAIVGWLVVSRNQTARVLGITGLLAIIAAWLFLIFVIFIAKTIVNG